MRSRLNVAGLRAIGVFGLGLVVTACGADAGVGQKVATASDRRIVSNAHPVVSRGLPDQSSTRWQPPRLLRSWSYSGDIRQLRLSDDLSTAVAETIHGELTVWDALTGSVRFVLPDEEAFDIALSGDGSSLLVGGADGELSLWNTRTGANTASVNLVGRIRAVALAPDGDSAAAAVADSLVILDMNADRVLRVLTDPEGGIDALAFSPGAGQLLAAGVGGFRAWNTADGTLAQQVETAYSMGTIMLFSRPPTHLAVSAGRLGDDIEVIDLSSGASFVITGVWADDLGFGPQSRVLLATGGGRLHCYLIQTGKALPKCNEIRASALATTSDGSHLLTAGEDGRMHLWALELRR